MWLVADDTAVTRFRPADMLSVNESVNTVNLIIDGRDPEAAKAYLVCFRNDAGSLTFTTILYFPASRNQQVYLPDPPETDIDDFNAVMEDGLQFLESMGFIMHGSYQKSRDEKSLESFLGNLPFLWRDREKYAKQREERLLDYARSVAPDPAASGVFIAPITTTGVRAASPQQADGEWADNSRLARLLATF
ncbi:MAG: hypothetical protein WC889_17570 [Myxococcota bacterium]|jgi:hypothetical protein